MFLTKIEFVTAAAELKKKEEFIRLKFHLLILSRFVYITFSWILIFFKEKYIYWNEIDF